MAPARKANKHQQREKGSTLKAEPLTLNPALLKSLLDNTRLYSTERRLLCELSREVLHKERLNLSGDSIDISLSAWCQTFGTDPEPARHQIEFSLQKLKQRALEPDPVGHDQTAWLVDFFVVDADVYRIEPSPWLRANLVQLACIIKLQDIYNTL